VDAFLNLKSLLFRLIAVLKFTIKDTQLKNNSLNGKHLSNPIYKNMKYVSSHKAKYTITNGCGGKKGTKCGVEVYVMPYAVAKPLTPGRAAEDNSEPKGK
jgi:hypothetical protein